MITCKQYEVIYRGYIDHKTMACLRPRVLICGPADLRQLDWNPEISLD